MKYLSKINRLFLYLIAFILGFKQIHEPDLWWMFRTGEWMVQNGQIPTVDVFSYTLKGTDWISVKWLFELIAYWMTLIGGPEFIGVLQGVVNVFIVFFLLRTTRYLAQFIHKQSITANHPFLLFSGLVVLFFIDYRLVGRPEMFSHLFTVILLYLYVRYKAKPGNFIFWLIPLQIVWVNMHEAFAVGIVLLLIIIGGELFQTWILKTSTFEKNKKLLGAAALAFLAVAVNPRGWYMFYHPYFLFSVVEENHYTNELNSVFYRPDFYFSYKEPYFFLALAGLALIGVLLAFRKEKKNIFSVYPLTFIGMMVAFTYLGMTGLRNVVFPILILSPFVIALSQSVSAPFQNKPWISGVKYAAMIVPVLCYVAIVTNVYYENFQSRDRYGLAIYSESNPAGASAFAREHGLDSQRAFSDYLTSAYFLWDQRPNFESFIDLRDLDIFPKSFFDEFIRITHFTNYFEESDEKYGYNHVLLYSGQFPALHRFLYHSPKWVQVYGDNIAAVYVKNNDVNQNLINQFSVDSTNLAGNFNQSFQPEPSGISNALSHIFWPGYQITRTDVDMHINASKYFRMVYDFDRAEWHAQQAIESKSNVYLGYNELGTMYLEIAPFKRNQQDQLRYIQMAQDAFQKGFKEDKSQWNCLYGLGLCAFMTQDYGYALKKFKQAAEINPNEVSIYVKMGDCYAYLSQQGGTEKTQQLYFETMEKAVKLAPDNMNLVSTLAVAYCQRNQCDLAKKHLKNYLRNSDVSAEVHDQVVRCKKKCGVN